MMPSKLHVTKKVPDLMPLRVIIAISSAFIVVEEAAIILVSSALVFLSATKLRNLNYNVVL